MKLRKPARVKAYSRTKNAQRKARSLPYDGSLYSSIPNGITSTGSYEPNRDLLTSIVDAKDGTTLPLQHEASNGEMNKKEIGSWFGNRNAIFIHIAPGSVYGFDGETKIFQRGSHGCISIRSAELWKKLRQSIECDQIKERDIPITIK